MNRNQTTGRFTRQDDYEIAESKGASIYPFDLSYKALIALFVLLYPWLIIVFNNSSRIRILINQLNAFILENIKKDGDLASSNSL